MNPRKVFFPKKTVIKHSENENKVGEFYVTISTIKVTNKRQLSQNI